MKVVIELVVFLTIMIIVLFILAMVVSVANIPETESTRGGFTLMWLVSSVVFYIFGRFSN